MVFAAIVLGATLLMTRIVRDPAGARISDPRLIVLGILLGLGALTRNETVLLALIWVVMAWRSVGASPIVRLRLIGIVGFIALAIFAPWAYRNLLEFGSPLPGQAVTNALYLTGYDIFAWNDPPTLARHLALGPVGLLQLRVTGLTHNLFNVLILLGMPMSVVGLSRSHGRLGVWRCGRSLRSARSRSWSPAWSSRRRRSGAPSSMQRALCMR